MERRGSKESKMGRGIGPSGKSTLYHPQKYREERKRKVRNGDTSIGNRSRGVKEGVGGSCFKGLQTNDFIRLRQKKRREE